MTNKRNRTSKVNNVSEVIEYTKADGTTAKELGVPGLSISLGKVKEDTLAILRGPKKIKLLEEMFRYDPMIGAFNTMLQSQVLSVEWSVQASDEKNTESVDIKDFINQVLFKDLSEGTFDDLVLNAMTKSGYGFAILEPVYKKRDGFKRDRNKSSIYKDGKIGISKFAPRYQGSITKFNYDPEFRNILTITQRNPNTYGDIEIPYDKVLHFKHNSVNNNPEGTSLYINCVVPYNRKKNTSLSEDQRYDKGFAGILRLTLPSAVLDPNTTNAMFKETVAWAKETGQNISAGRSQSIIAPEYVKTEILTSGNDNSDADKIIERCNREIAVALLSDFFLITQKSGNSGALGQSKIKVFKTLINSMLDEVANELNMKLIPSLMDKNSLNRELAPIVKHTEIEDLDLTNLMLFIQSADKSGLIAPDVETSNFIKRKVMGKDVPMTDKETFDKYQNRRETITNDSLDKPNASTLKELDESDK